MASPHTVRGYAAILLQFPRWPRRPLYTPIATPVQDDSQQSRRTRRRHQYPPEYAYPKPRPEILLPPVDAAQPRQIRYTQLRSRYAPGRRTRRLRRRAYLSLAKWAKALPGEQVSSWFSEPRDCRNRRQLSHSR